MGHRGGFWGWIYVGAAALVAPGLAHATQPPAPGVEMDPETRERLGEINRASVLHGLLPKVRAAAGARAAEAQGRKVAPGTKAVAGTTAVPVILVKYANTPADPYPNADLQTELFDGPWATGTMADFYDEISYGNLDVTGTVFDWAQLAQDDTYYEGGCNGLCVGAPVEQLIIEAVGGLDGSVDFGQFDNDGPDGVPNSGDDDGFVDFAAFVHPEAGGECGNSNIWSHRYSLTGQGVLFGYQTNDPRPGGGFVRVDDYTIQPAYACNGVTMIEIGIFCHEFGHAFGLPDMYDTDNSSEGDGHWALMASGNWNRPTSPGHMMAYSKVSLGWITPTVVSTPQVGVAVPNVEQNPFALKIPFGAPVGAGQYYLVENRARIGFDQWAKAEGLAIWHVDEGKQSLALVNAVNTQECIDGPVSGACGGNHFLVALEQADGDFDLERNLNRSD
ncbi:MAG: M6 family metalloprotease domain-containing protein, partial [Myxococcales bacterium]|nr:M6 family metalloprotease domain-containing protein [Myxococcales bacterium]